MIDPTQAAADFVSGLATNRTEYAIACALRLPGQYCAACGLPERGVSTEVARDLCSGLEPEKPWRCMNCFAMQDASCLYCSSCGAQNSQAPASINTLLTHYDNLGLCCAAFAGKLDAETENGLKILRGTVWFYCLLLAVVLAASAIPQHLRNAQTDMTVSSALYVIIILFLAFDWRRVLPLFRIPASSRILGYLVPLTAAPVTIGLAMSQLAVFPFLKKYWISYSAPYLQHGFGWGTVEIWNACFPAFFEEIAFRGIILWRLLQLMPAASAIVVSSLMFAILHISIIALFFFLFPMAIVAAWLSWRTKSLLPGMVLHFLHNSAIIYLEYLHRG